MLCTREARRNYWEKDLPLFKSNKKPFPENIKLNNRDDLINHLFKPNELQSYQQQGKMHILQNIPQSTLGYFRGESLISINELEIDRAEMDHIAIQEMYEFEENGNDVLTLPIAVGYVLVKENKLEEKERPFSTYIMPTAINHIKHTNDGMYQSSYIHSIIPQKRISRQNIHWLPYYP